MAKNENPLVDLELKSLKDAQDIYSLKINGNEIGQFVSELHLDLKAHELPVLTIKLNAEKLSIQSKAVLEIPEPYKSFI